MPELTDTFVLIIQAISVSNPPARHKTVLEDAELVQSPMHSTGTWIFLFFSFLLETLLFLFNGDRLFGIRNRKMCLNFFFAELTSEC